MKKSILALSLLVLTGCSLNTPHVGNVVDVNNGTYSTEIVAGKLHVVASFSEYQFVRSSESGFRGCTRVMNNAARIYTVQNNKSYHPITWRTMQDYGYIDHGRDILTAIMNVNCEYYYKLK